MEQQVRSPAAMKVIIAWFLKNFRYYVVFSKSIFFVLGLLFTYRFVEYAIFEILVTHITEEWKKSNLSKAVVIVNLKDGVYEVLQIFFAYIADGYMEIFWMLVSSSILYIIGLVLCTVAASPVGGGLHRGIFYTALVLITLAQSAKRVTLKSFLGDQISAQDDEEERAISRCKFWWNSVSVLAAIVAMVVSSNINTFQVLSMASAVAMGVGFLWFLLGWRSYNRVKPTGSPLDDVVWVIYTAVAKRIWEYPQSSEQLLPHVPWLRWLDRAAIASQDQENPGNNNVICNCTVEQVMGVKFLLKMLPLWATFLTFSLVAATGSTFFLEEATNINKDFPILFFVVPKGFTQFVFAEASDFVVEKIGKKNNNIMQRLLLVRIGIGMIFCFLCCVAAWKNAVLTLGGTESVGVFRMVPQFLLLGAMEGLSGGGLESFFDSQVSRSISKYGPSFGESVMGVGKFLSAGCVLSFGNLFKSDINGSSLDKYYAGLAVVTSTNMLVYWLVAYWYGDGRYPLADYGGDIVPSGLANGVSDSSPLLREVRTFPRMLSKRINKRFNSMH